MSMLTPILSAAKYLPAKSAVGLVKKVFPSLKKFFDSKALTGFTANQILDYLTERSDDKTFLHRLGRLEGKNLLTPEEKILHRKEKEREATGDIAKKLIGFGVGSLGSDEEEESVSPDEIMATPNEQRPSRVGHEEQKRLGGPIPQPTGKGSVINVPPNAEQAHQANMISNAPQYDPLSSIMQKYPELAQFIQREAQNGLDAETIARRARTQPFARKYGPMIDEIESMIDEPFEILLGRLMGSAQPKVQPKQAAGQEDLLRALQELRRLRGG